MSGLFGRLKPMASPKPKIFICTHRGDEFEAEDLSAILGSRGFDVYPKQPAPGTPRDFALDQWMRELAGADLYILLNFAKFQQEWDPAIAEAVYSKEAGHGPAVLPIVHSSVPLKVLPAFARAFIPLRYETYNELIERVIDVIPTLLASRQSPRSMDLGSENYIAEITLDSFFAFREPQALLLQPTASPASRWTVILGDNGTGKTTLLRAVAALCAGAPELWTKSASGCSIKVVRDLDGTEVLENAKPTDRKSVV